MRKNIELIGIAKCSERTPGHPVIAHTEKSPEHLIKVLIQVR